MEYIFWLYSWRDMSLPLFETEIGHFKCIVTPQKIKIIPIENNSDRELTVDVSLIQKCKLFYNSQNRNRAIELYLNDKRIVLSPVNPFGLSRTLHMNHSETTALLNLINALKAGAKPDTNPNPYLRQLATKDNLKRYRELNIEWDKHVSPWDYYELYGDKFIWLKTIAIMLASIAFSVAIVVGLVALLIMFKII